MRTATRQPPEPGSNKPNPRYESASFSTEKRKNSDRKNFCAARKPDTGPIPARVSHNSNDSAFSLTARLYPVRLNLN
jgi:hypothetical protein